jgi:LysR family nitrogen assimilation transcriptional regulator
VVGTFIIRFNARACEIADWHATITFGNRRRLMDFKQLRAFLTVAETGNVTRAAEVLHLVQPAVSRQVKLLEADIGAPLFVRERHGMVLTDAGRALVPHARRAMLELDRARAEIAGTSAAADTGLHGLVTLGLLPSTIDMLSGPLVAGLAAQHPGIRLRIAMGYAGTLLGWLQTGEIDAGLLYGPERSSAVRTEPLIEEPLWVIGPAAAKLRRNKPVSLAMLAGKPLVLPSAPHGIRTLVDHACAVANIGLTVSAETNALSVQRSLVLGGHGLTILPPIAVADDLHSGQLSGAPLTDPALARTIVLALPSDRPTGAHVRCAVNLLVAQARQAIHAGAWLEGRWLGG